MLRKTFLIPILAATLLSACARTVTIREYRRNGTQNHGEGVNVFTQEEEDVSVTIRYFDRYRIRDAAVSYDDETYRRHPLLSVFFFVVSNESDAPVFFSPSGAKVVDNMSNEYLAYSIDRFKDEFADGTLFRDEYLFLFQGGIDVRTLIANAIDGVPFFNKGYIEKGDASYGFLVFPQIDTLARRITLSFPKVRKGTLIPDAHTHAEETNATGTPDDEGDAGEGAVTEREEMPLTGDVITNATSYLSFIFHLRQRNVRTLLEWQK